MPLYYLHVSNSVGNARDTEGQDLPDLDAARTLAVDSIRSIVAEEAKAGKIDLAGHIEIADTEGRVLGEVRYSEAFELTLGERC